jgi:hypothetical protein
LQRENLNGNLSGPIQIFGTWEGSNSDVEFDMEFQIDDDDDEANAKKFRGYAAECRRLARTAAEQDRAVLVEIADAWILCAEQAERDGRRNRGR